MSKKIHFFQDFKKNSATMASLKTTKIIVFKKIQNNITKYLLDHINPNEKDGIELYSEAVINSSP